MKSLREPPLAVSETGRIFDIRRFCIHDGDGVRTGVFFQGCPLTCAWCHNPEGMPFERKPVWLRGRCMRCGGCAAHARAGGVSLSADGVCLRPDAPEDWDDILDMCPTGALCWNAREMRVDTVVRDVLRDRVFFRDGGGVTLTGGEPLMQPTFARALLHAFCAKNIHTAIETSLYARWEDILGLLPFLDLIYCDVKIFDDAAHRRWSGVSNETILANIRRLLDSDRHVVVRTPLIPGVTATEENIRKIAGFLYACRPDVEYELLNYNPLTPAKYPTAGRHYALEGTLPLSKAEWTRMYDVARDAGIHNLVRDDV